MKTLLQYISKSRDVFLDALFPAVCIGCGKEGNYVCGRCTLFLNEAEPICPRCYRQNITGETHSACQKGDVLDGLVSVWEYEGLVKSLLRTIQEGGVSHAVLPITELAFRYLVEQQERYAPFFRVLLSSEGAITFVPRLLKEERRQGFNHAFLIAKAMGRVSGKEPVSLLQKLHDIALQHAWNWEKREEMVQDSFSFVKPSLAFPREVVLVDDLWRSGMTLQECAAVLKRAGIEKVWGFTLAKVA